MLYGRHDGPTGLLIGAADTLADFQDCEHPTCSHELVEPDFLALMRDERFNRFKCPPRVYVFESAADRDAYAVSAKISMETVQRLVDLNAAMVAAEIERTSNEDTRTIAQIHGLDEHDPWDDRSEEQKERDAKTEELIKKAKADGRLSGDDSFAAPKKGTKIGNVTINEVVKVGPGGGVSISVTARKAAESDTDKPKLGLEMFDPSAVYNRVFVVDRKVDELSVLLDSILTGLVLNAEDTDTGCWADFLLQRHALDAVGVLTAAGVAASTLTVNALGEQMLPEGTRVVDEKEARVIGPRPWKDQAEWDALDDAARAEEIKLVGPDEFLMCGYTRGIHGSRVYFIPRSYWKEHEDFWTGDILLDGIMPDYMKANVAENHPGRYDSILTWNQVSLTLNRSGYREDMMFQIHVNGIKMFP